MYKIVSDIGKDIRKIELPYSLLAKRLKEVDRWDSENAILLSPSSIVLIFELRNILDGYNNFNQNYDTTAQVGRKAREEIFEAVLSLEQAIKKEIGVYDAEGYHKPQFTERYPNSWKYLSDEK